MSKLKIQFGADDERIAGLDDSTSLIFKLFAGSDYPHAQLYVAAYRRDGEQIVQRHSWTFPVVTRDTPIVVTLVESGTTSPPDEIDLRRGELARDEEILIRDGIQRTEYMIARLGEKFRGLEAAQSNENLRYCVFCGKRKEEVRFLIAGPSVFICNECIDRCNEIIATEISGDA